MTCNHHLERDESIDSIKWYKDGKEFYRNVFSTSNDRDRVISYNISGTSSLDPQLSGVSYRNVVAIKPFMLTNTEAYRGMHSLLKLIYRLICNAK